VRALVLDESWNGALAALAREPLPGPVSLSYRKEPDFFRAAAMSGEDFDVLGAIEGERLAVAGTRSWQKAWLDGKECRVGYISALRSDPSLRGGIRFAKAYALLREIDAPAGGSERESPLYYCSFLEGGKSGGTLSKRRPGLLRFQAAARFVSRNFFLSRGKGGSRAPRARAFAGVERGRASDFPGLLEFLDREGSMKQLRPVAAGNPLFAEGPRDPCTGPGAWWVLVRDGKIRAALSAWDQRPARRIRVEGFSPSFALFRRAANAFLSASGRNPIPGPGDELPLAYISFCAAEGNDPRLLAALVPAALAELGKDGSLSMATVAFDQRDPLARAFAGRFSVSYAARLHFAYWEDAPRSLPDPGRLFAPESGIL
jgi:hypothetical protein